MTRRSRGGERPQPGEYAFGLPAHSSSGRAAFALILAVVFDRPEHPAQLLVRQARQDLRESLEDIAAALPGGLSFDTDLPSFGFDITRGMRKTKLLAGCIVYLARNGYSRNLFVIAPGETIYAKLIREFTPGEPAYLFKGIGGMDDMRVVTGDDYLYRSH